VKLALALFVPFVALAQTAHPAFEVASVKTNPDGPGHSGTHRNGHNLRMQNSTLRTLIAFAYSVTPPQVIGPEWLDAAGYDIDATGAPGTEDQVPQMLQVLLADRFKLGLHREMRELSVFALVIVKGGIKMQKAAEGGARGTISSSSRGDMKAQGVTMAKFANLLAAPGFGLDHPVLDQTSLTDVYDFTLRWTPETTGEPRREEANAPPPLFAAMQEQLGLKLEPRKAPVEVLMVDHAERVPTEN